MRLNPTLRRRADLAPLLALVAMVGQLTMALLHTLPVSPAPGRLVVVCTAQGLKQIRVGDETPAPGGVDRAGMCAHMCTGAMLAVTVALVLLVRLRTSVAAMAPARSWRASARTAFSSRAPPLAA